MSRSPGLRRIALSVVACCLTFAATEAQEPAVSCKVSGYDVIIYNEGSSALASGTALEWAVPFARMDGEHELVTALEPGGREFLSGALGASFLGSKTPCEITIADG